jgi:hypothetical protein
VEHGSGPEVVEAVVAVVGLEAEAAVVAAAEVAVEAVHPEGPPRLRLQALNARACIAQAPPTQEVLRA